MRLSQNTEYAVVAGLILYSVFMPSFSIVRQLFSSSVGVAAGVALVYWVAKTVSVPLALVVLVAVVRSSSAVLREHMDCTECPPDYKYDEKSKMCKKEGATDVPPSCAAPKGMDSSKPAPTPSSESSTPSK
jgi:hypothetical protein